MTVSFPVQINNIPAYKGAARQMGIDLITEPFEPDKPDVVAHALISDYSQLVALGFVAGMDAMCNSIKNDLGELESILESKIINFENNKNKQK